MGNVMESMGLGGSEPQRDIRDDLGDLVDPKAERGDPQAVGLPEIAEMDPDLLKGFDPGAADEVDLAGEDEPDDGSFSLGGKESEEREPDEEAAAGEGEEEGFDYGYEDETAPGSSDMAVVVNYVQHLQNEIAQMRATQEQSARTLTGMAAADYEAARQAAAETEPDFNENPREWFAWQNAQNQALMRRELGQLLSVQEQRAQAAQEAQMTQVSQAQQQAAASTIDASFNRSSLFRDVLETVTDITMENTGAQGGQARQAIRNELWAGARQYGWQALQQGKDPAEHVAQVAAGLYGLDLGEVPGATSPEGAASSKDYAARRKAQAGAPRMGSAGSPTGKGERKPVSTMDAVDAWKNLEKKFGRRKGQDVFMGKLAGT
jgi:hypothetical protein